MIGADGSRSWRDARLRRFAGYVDLSSYERDKCGLLASTRELKISVTGRKISLPVCFIEEGDTLYLLSVKVCVAWGTLIWPGEGDVILLKVSDLARVYRVSEDTNPTSPAS